MTPEIAIIAPITDIQPEILIASTSKEPIITGFITKNERSKTIQRNVERGGLQRDTIVKDFQTKAGQNKVNPADNRKVEKKMLTGFIMSIIGLIPIVGLPFAIIGLVYGIKNLRKIRRNPTLYKGKGFGIASIVLGVLGILVSLTFLGSLVGLLVLAVNLR